MTKIKMGRANALAMSAAWQHEKLKYTITNPDAKVFFQWH